MAVRTSSHSTNDWDRAENWSGTTPISNDVAVVGAGCVIDQTTDVAALTAVDLDLLHIRADCQVNLGASGTPITMSADEIIYEAGSNSAGTAKEFWFTDGSGGPTDKMTIDASSPNAVIHLGGATITEVMANRGKVYADSGVTITSLSIGYKDSPQADVHATLSVGATVTNCYQGAGKVTSQIAVTEARIANGEWVQDSAAITTAVVGPGGRLVLKHSAITSIILLPGSILDISQFTGQITVATKLIKHRGARIIGNWQNTNFFVYPAATSIVVE